MEVKKQTTTKKEGQGYINVTEKKLEKKNGKRNRDEEGKKGS